MTLPTCDDIPMTQLVEQVLPFRSSKYVEDFCEKLLGEGIAAPADLLRVSKEALETKLSTHAAFNFIEMADAVSLRASLDRGGGGGNNGGGNGAKNGHAGRSRSPEQRRGRERSRSPGRGGKGRRGKGKRDRGSRRENSRPSRPQDKEPKVKPELWAAIERNETDTAKRLLLSGANAEETFDGWTPLMKAAEENRVDILNMLIEKGVDLDATNRKGRTALSFAAAPSKNNETGKDRETSVECIRLLLRAGADPNKKSIAGKGKGGGRTPREYAEAAERDDAVRVFAEFGH